MTKEEMEQRFRALLSSFFGCKEDQLNPHTNFIDEFEIDSLGILMLICLLEESFGIPHDDDATYSQLATYESAFSFLWERFQEKELKEKNCRFPKWLVERN